VISEGADHEPGGEPETQRAQPRRQMREAGVGVFQEAAHALEDVHLERDQRPLGGSADTCARKRA